MAENPLQPLFQTFQKVSDCVRTQFSSLTGQSDHPSPSSQKFDFSFSSLLPKISPTKTDTALVQSQDILIKEKPAAPVTKEELGRATWTFLHTLAAQYPENPTRQQKKDIKELMAIMSRMYPCKDCADHFKEVLRANPVQAGSHAEFSLWLCHVHNVVNRSLGKLIFPCERVDSRWGKLECEQRACDVQGNTTIFRED